MSFEMLVTLCVEGRPLGWSSFRVVVPGVGLMLCEIPSLNGAIAGAVAQALNRGLPFKIEIIGTIDEKVAK